MAEQDEKLEGKHCFMDREQNKKTNVFKIWEDGSQHPKATDPKKMHFLCNQSFIIHMQKHTQCASLFIHEEKIECNMDMEIVIPTVIGDFIGFL